MSDNELDTTVELDRSEVLAALRRSKREDRAEDSDVSGSHNEDLRAAIHTIKRWAEDNEQWLVILAPWGMHHYGKLTSEQVELIIKRFNPEE